MNIFREMLYTDHGQTLLVEDVLYEGRTEHQDVFIFTNPTFGKVFVLDGVVQFTERDNHIYHEMLTHVPMMAHPAPRNVLIIGGGDGGALKEALKHPIHSAVLVELDADVIDLCRNYFPELSDGAFDDGRAEIIHGDGAAYVRRTTERFDVIIIDSTDPVGPGEALFSDEFYRHCQRALRPGGLISIQSGAPFYQTDQFTKTLRRVAARFGCAKPFLAPVPTYAHGLLALIVAGESDMSCPPADVLRDRLAELVTTYYSPEVHHAAFVTAPRFNLANSLAETTATGAAA